MERLITRRNLARVSDGREDSGACTWEVRISMARDELREEEGVRLKNMWAVLGSSDIIFKASGGFMEEMS